MEPTIRIRNARLLCPEPTDASDLIFRRSGIVRLGAPDAPPDVDFDAGGAFVTPGFIDALVHGAGGAGTMDAAPESIYTIAERHARFGTTALACGISAAPMDRLLKTVDAIGEATHHPSDRGARVLGVYVEGKFGTPAKRGAHLEEYLAKPTIEAFETLWNASRGTIRVFSYAVEEDEGFKLTRHLAERQDDYRGVVPTMGHTNADYETACRAIDAGVRRATHTLNGMTPLHHRHLGAAEAAMNDSRVHAEIIGDGHHVHPVWARFIMRLKGMENVSLITDALFAAAMDDDELPSLFDRDPESGAWKTRQGRAVYLRDGALYLHPTDDFLTGSVITLNDAVRNAIAWGVSPSDAVRMASANPARSLGLARKGELRAGFDADIAAFDQDWNPLAVWVEGREIVNRLRRI